ncbi:MAG: S24 family peptidase [Bacteroidaceae bacterium]|nr:S24 family peptidase [Bacteroidaceae bacterium]
MDSVRKEIVGNELLMQSIKELIKEGHTVTLTVKGVSMTPFLINQRDSVVIAPLTTSSLNIGTIVLAKEKNRDRYLLHRIVKQRKDGYQLRGDGNCYGTEEIATEDIVGYVKSATRNKVRVDYGTLKWRLLWYIWRYMLPIRRLLLAIYNHIIKRK